MKPWQLSTINIAAILALVVTVLESVSALPFVSKDIALVIVGIVIPAFVFIRRTWFTTEMTTAPFGLFKKSS